MKRAKWLVLIFFVVTVLSCGDTEKTKEKSADSKETTSTTEDKSKEDKSESEIEKLDKVIKNLGSFSEEEVDVDKFVQDFPTKLQKAEELLGKDDNSGVKKEIKNALSESKLDEKEKKDVKRVLDFSITSLEKTFSNLRKIAEEKNKVKDPLKNSSEEIKNAIEILKSQVGKLRKENTVNSQEPQFKQIQTSLSEQKNTLTNLGLMILLAAVFSSLPSWFLVFKSFRGKGQDLVKDIQTTGSDSKSYSVHEPHPILLTTSEKEEQSIDIKPVLEGLRKIENNFSKLFDLLETPTTEYRKELQEFMAMMKDKEEKQDRKKTEFTENRVSMEFPASTASLVSYYQKQKNRLIYVEPANAFQLDQLVESENGSYLLVPSDRGDFYYVFPAATKFDSPQNFARVSAVYNRVGQASTGEVWIHKPARVVKHQDNLWVLNKKGELSLGRK